jgi:hypothetical protein
LDYQCKSNHLLSQSAFVHIFGRGSPARAVGLILKADVGVFHRHPDIGVLVSVSWHAGRFSLPDR